MRYVYVTILGAILFLGGYFLGFKNGATLQIYAGSVASAMLDIQEIRRIKSGNIRYVIEYNEANVDSELRAWAELKSSPYYFLVKVTHPYFEETNNEYLNKILEYKNNEQLSDADIDLIKEVERLMNVEKIP